MHLTAVYSGDRGFSFARNCVLCKWESETLRYIIKHKANKGNYPLQKIQRLTFEALALCQSESTKGLSSKCRPLNLLLI